MNAKWPNKKKPASAPKKTVICISGMAGTGKSTLSKKLAEKYGLKIFFWWRRFKRSWQNTKDMMFLFRVGGRALKD